MDYEADNKFGELTEKLNFSIQELAKYTSAFDYGMTEFSNGNFTCKCPIEFIGDFAHIQEGIETFQQKMDTALSEVSVTAVQVNDGAAQISDSAQTLAQGATVQAGSVQQHRDGPDGLLHPGYGQGCRGH